MLGAAPDIDVGLERVRRGDAPCVLRPLAGNDRTALEGAYRDLGFAVGASREGTWLAVAADDGTVREVLGWFDADERDQRRTVVEAIGHLLGFPQCCVRAYARQVEHGPTQDARATLARSGDVAPSPLLNRAGRFRLVEHHPCRHDCSASLALASEALARLRSVSARAADHALEHLGRTHLLLGDSAFELTGSWTGDTFHFDHWHRTIAGTRQNEMPPSGRVVMSTGTAAVVDESGHTISTVGDQPALIDVGRPAVPAAGARRDATDQGSPGTSAGDAPGYSGTPLDALWLPRVGDELVEGLLVTEVRASSRLDVLFAADGTSGVLWARPAEPDVNAFARDEHIAVGHDGAGDATLAAATRALWARLEGHTAELRERLSVPEAGGTGAGSIPRNAPKRWTGDGPAPPFRRRVLAPDETEQFFHVDFEWTGEDRSLMSRVGVIYRCDQWCIFCGLSNMDAKLPRERVIGAIEAARRRGSTSLILTGGEPTLSPDLTEYVEHAAALGFTEIVLQTNAVRLSKPGRATRLREAGLTTAQVSLHGPDPDVSDFLTFAPGTHAKTLAGIDQLLDNGIRVLVNHLIFRANAGLLDRFLSMAKERWGAHRGSVVLQFRSPKNEFDDLEQARTYLAPYSEYAETLVRIMDEAREFGFETSELLEPTCLPSLCVLDRYGVDVHALTADSKQMHHAWESPWFRRVPGCKDCSMAARCQGAPADYVEVFGDAEFTPL